MHVMDVREMVPVEGLRVAPQECGRGVAGLPQRFCSQLAKRQHPGVKVARLTQDDRLGPRELKNYRLITKQVFAGLAPGSSMLPSGTQGFPFPTPPGPT
uniref:Uncharacterized protein n=1 Tax=Equus caballus TaxID=9796 RepID=A0A9L0RWK6_HORSE